jgi:apolipoprotein N-acyltransferase
MAFRNVTIVIAVTALCVSSALFYLGTGQTPQWWALWLALLSVLLAAARLPAIAAFGVAAVAFFLGSLNMLDYTRTILALPDGPHFIGPETFAVLTFMGLPALMFGVAVLVFRCCVRRGALWQAALGFAALWTAYEYLTATLSPHGTFGNLAYTQMASLPTVQIASMTGIWGVSFSCSS